MTQITPLDYNLDYLIQKAFKQISPIVALDSSEGFLDTFFSKVPILRYQFKEMLTIVFQLTDRVTDII